MTYSFENAQHESSADRSVIKLVLGAFLAGWLLYSELAPHPYRDGAERFIRSSAVTADTVGDIRGMTLKRTEFGNCKPRCDTYVFSVDSTRAIARVSVKSWQGPQGKPEFRISHVERS